MTARSPSDDQARALAGGAAYSDRNARTAVSGKGI